MARVTTPVVAKVCGIESYDLPTTSSDGSLADDLDVPDHGVYIVMERVEGETLDRLFTGIPRPADVLPVMLEAGRALASIDRAGLVHRDVKPGNIMVRPASCDHARGGS